MAQITFYEKPGCINGEKQKTILSNAGNELSCINLLEKKWTKEELLKFVQGKTAPEMMNATAPAIKQGAIKPDELEFDQAITLMIAEPILIKRPLIEVDGQYIQGFNNPKLTPYLGDWEGKEDVITCPNLQTLSCDEQKAES